MPFSRPQYFRIRRNNPPLPALKSGAIARRYLPEGFAITDATDRYLPANVLIDLYVRLRDEMGSCEISLDPNHKLRAAIVMAILGAAEIVGDDIFAIEARVREAIRRDQEPLAA